MYTQKQIHDQILQSAGLGSKPLRLRVITFNLGDNKKTQEQWSVELAKWKEINRFDYDILSFALQEDFADMFAVGHLMNALSSLLIKNGFKTAAIDGTKPLKFNEQFAVKAATFIQSRIYNHSFIPPKTYLGKKSICIGSGIKRLACTKASVGISIRLGAPYNLHYTFIGSHMPIETSKDDLGFQARINAMNQTVNNVVKPLVFPLQRNNNTLLIWAGDLNFRKDLQKKDQLTTALEASFDVGLGSQKGFGVGLQENVALLASIQPTCKLVTCSGEQCPNCRKHPEVADPTCYDSGAKHGKEPKVPRLPSNCDRILYRFWPANAHQLTLSSSGYAAFVEPAVLQSDHNAVKADFTML